MEQDLHDIIKEQVEHATGEEISDDGSSEVMESTETVEASGEGQAVETEAVEETPAVEAADDKKPTADEMDTFIASELKALKVQDSQQRIPRSKVRRIIENAEKRLEKKLKEAHAKEIEGGLARFQPYFRGRAPSHDDIENLLKTYGQVDDLIARDPDRYLGMLAAIHPAYKKYLGGNGNGNGHQPKQDDDPMPQPDAKFPDGTMGYSMEGLQKRDEWQRRQILKEARTLIDENNRQFQPIRQEYDARREVQQRAPQIQAEIDYNQRIWGDLIHQHADDILKVMKAAEARRQPITFTQACAEVLVPVLHTDENTMRARVLKEINQRPRAARQAPTAAASQQAPREPQSTSEVIRQQLVADGILS